MSKFLVIFLCLMFIIIPVEAQQPTSITLVTHDSFAVSEDVLAQFEDETGIAVNILRSGDAGTLVNQSILSKENPLGDVLYGVDNTFLGRALDADIFIPYESALLENIPQEFLIDPNYRVTPVDYGDICLNYDRSYFAEQALALPDTLEVLAEPDYKGLLVVQNPATSSPGLGFLLATIAHFGTEGDYTYLDYWQDLIENDVYISDDWSDAYYTQFSGSSGSQGIRPLVVSYASSPPVEVYFMEEQPEMAPTGSITADDMCFRQIEFVGILRGTENEAAAQQFVDFMVDKVFQEDLPLQMFVYPVNTEAELPEIFTAYSSVPENPVTLPIEDINNNRELWLQQWTETILR